MKDLALNISENKMLFFRQEGETLLMTFQWPNRPPDISLGSVTTVRLSPEQVAALKAYLDEES